MISLEYIGGFFDGEGCVSMSVTRRYSNNKERKTPEIQPYITITQKKPLILYAIQESLEELGIPSKVLLSDKSCARLRISSIDDVLKFCTLVTPFTFCKRKELELMMEYCEYRISQRMGRNQSKPYTDRDYEYVVALSLMKK